MSLEFKIPDLLGLTKGLSYLWMLLFIMMISGLAKDRQLFSSAFSYIQKLVKSKKAVVVLTSVIGGVLPIEGRVTVSAGLLDSLAKSNREKFGIVDYLATHHYYMWSPLEKTVIVPIAAFGLSYVQWLNIIWPLLLASLIFIFVYIWRLVDDFDINLSDESPRFLDFLVKVVPMVLSIAGYIYGFDPVLCFGILLAYYVILTKEVSAKRLFSYVNWKLLLIVTIVILVGNYVKLHSSDIESFIQSCAVTSTGFNLVYFQTLALVSVLSFLASLALGSSGKFIALAVLVSQIYGPVYFIWFFAIDFAGYLLSPTHKCVAIGNRYFQTPLTDYYRALGLWSVLLLLVAALTVTSRGMISF